MDRSWHQKYNLAFHATAFPCSYRHKRLDLGRDSIVANETAAMTRFFLHPQPSIVNSGLAKSS